eukprot:1153219-Rhodomonas_salina.1
MRAAYKHQQLGWEAGSTARGPTPSRLSDLKGSKCAPLPVLFSACTRSTSPRLGLSSLRGGFPGEISGLGGTSVFRSDPGSGDSGASSAPCELRSMDL